MSFTNSWAREWYCINFATTGGCNQMCDKHWPQLWLPLAGVHIACLWKLFEGYSIISAQGKVTRCWSLSSSTSSSNAMLCLHLFALSLHQWIPTTHTDFLASSSFCGWSDLFINVNLMFELNVWNYLQVWISPFFNFVLFYLLLKAVQEYTAQNFIYIYCPCINGKKKSNLHSVE